MKFKWKITIASTLLVIGIYLSVHQKYLIDTRSIDSAVQPRAQKSGEEKNYIVKQAEIASPLVEKANGTKSKPPSPSLSSDVYLNESITLFPWINRRNYLPNYFITNITEEEKSSYKNSVIIYLHHNKAAGTTTKRCMLKVIPASGKKLGPVLASGTRISVSKRLSSPTYRNTHNVYMGGYSFGMCDDIKKPCSYFTIFRDPFHRSISSFSYCRRARSDQLCRAQNPWKVTLKQWTIHQGSFLFRQLLFHPKFCTEFKNNFKSNLLPHDIYGSTPCWFRQHVVMTDLLSKKQIDALVDFCVDNIEKWFAVVGLTEDYNSTLNMLQEVYGVPFTHCAGSVQNTSGRYNNLSKNTTSLENYARMVDELRTDADVQRAMYPDIRLYNKIKEIFLKQKTKMESKTEYL